MKHIELTIKLTPKLIALLNAAAAMNDWSSEEFVIEALKAMVAASGDQFYTDLKEMQ